MTPIILYVDSLDEAISAIEKVDSHQVGVQIMALKAVFRLVKFEDVDPKTANIVKQEMLSRGGDVAVSKNVGMFKTSKTDMIIMGTLAQHIRLIRKLKKQDYGDCLKIAKELQNLLLRDINPNTDNVL